MKGKELNKIQGKIVKDLEKIIDAIEKAPRENLKYKLVFFLKSCYVTYLLSVGNLNMKEKSYICKLANTTVTACTRSSVKCNIFIASGNVYCIYTTVFRKCIRDYLTTKGRTEMRIASGFRNSESLIAPRELPRDLVFERKEEEEEEQEERESGLAHD
ncbi:hypothetical protein DBV15_08485 [Temnothorax longispinosus]|uniref:Uncharacterized protein n=1 Tax=Temnothorax longispinosus TaxID=300112 RepID=A0A4S2KMX7_9HYME|nr:hypothetical protein DBV15_08485 [Temnothorax longispinosus]